MRHEELVGVSPYQEGAVRYAHGTVGVDELGSHGKSPSPKAVVSPPAGLDSCSLTVSERDCTTRAWETGRMPGCLRGTPAVHPCPDYLVP
jgi:hypothetical protein